MKMTDKEVIDELQSDSLLNKVRKEFYHGAAKLEQADAQRKPPGSIDRRRMEFEIAKKIINIVEEECEEL